MVRKEVYDGVTRLACYEPVEECAAERESFAVHAEAGSRPVEEYTEEHDSDTVVVG